MTRVDFGHQVHERNSERKQEFCQGSDLKEFLICKIIILDYWKITLLHKYIWYYYVITAFYESVGYIRVAS